MIFRYNVDGGKVEIKIVKDNGRAVLSIVKHAVQYHSGKIVLESEVKKGTTIKIFF